MLVKPKLVTKFRRQKRILALINAIKFQKRQLGPTTTCAKIKNVKLATVSSMLPKKNAPNVVIITRFSGQMHLDNVSVKKGTGNQDLMKFVRKWYAMRNVNYVMAILV